MPLSLSCCCSSAKCRFNVSFSVSTVSVCPRDTARPVMRSVVRHSTLFWRHGVQPSRFASHRIFRIYHATMVTNAFSPGPVTISCLRGMSAAWYVPCNDRTLAPSSRHSHQHCWGTSSSCWPCCLWQRCQHTLVPHSCVWSADAHLLRRRQGVSRASSHQMALAARQSPRYFPSCPRSVVDRKLTHASAYPVTARIHKGQLTDGAACAQRKRTGGAAHVAIGMPPTHAFRS